MTVPASAPRSTLSSPPASSTRSRMPASPKPSSGVASVSKPTPSSATDTSTASPAQRTSMSTEEAWACLTTLVSDSWTTR